MASQANLGALRISLLFNTAQFKKNISGANKDLSKFESQAKLAVSTLSKTAKSLSTMAIGIAKFALPIAGAAGAIFALTNKTVDALDVFDKMSKRTGLSTDTLQEMNFATSQVGASMEAVETSVLRISKAMYDAKKGLKASKEAFDDLGVEITNSDGSLRSLDSVFPEVIRKLQDMENETERNATAMTLMGRAGAKDLITVLGTSAEEWDNLRQTAHDAGLVIGGESIKSAVNFKDALGKVLDQLKTTGQQLLVSFIPVFQNTLIPLLRNVVVPIFREVAGAVNFIGKIFFDNSEKVLKLKDATKKTADEFTTIKDNTVNLKKAILDLFTDWEKKAGETTVNIANSFKTLANIGAMTTIVTQLRELQQELYKSGNFKGIQQLAGQFDFLTKEQQASITQADGLNGVIKALGDIAVDLEDKLNNLSPELKNLPANFFLAATQADTLRKSMKNLNGQQFTIKNDEIKNTESSIKSLDVAIQNLQTRWTAFIGYTPHIVDGMTSISMSAFQLSETMKIFEVDTLEATQAFLYSIKDAVVQGAASLKEFGDVVVLQARQFVRAKIAEGVTGYVASALSTIPFPFGIIAAGIAGAAATALFNTIVPGFAEGGIVTGATMAMVGEAGTEVIFPLSDLKRFLQEPGRGRQVVYVEGRLQGEDIKISQQRANKFREKFL